MKQKLVLTTIAICIALPAFAGDDAPTQLPEPSTLGLFAAAAIAITVLSKLKK